MIDDFSEITLDNEVTVVRLKENQLVCSYDNFLLEIHAETLKIMSLSTEQLRLQVEKLQYFKLTRKDKT